MVNDKRIENVRLFQERAELVLHSIQNQDSLAAMVEKINTNFNIIKEHQGGRMGLPGLPGLPGCSAEPQFINETGGEGGELFKKSNTPTSLCLAGDSSNKENIEQKIQFIHNQFANNTLVLSNLSDDNGDINIKSLDEFSPTIVKLPDDSFDSKLIILHSDKDGYGKHISLLNSKAIVENRLYGCKSGFDISVDKTNNENIEILNIKHNRNLDIEHHNSIVEFTTDTISIKKDEGRQKLNIISEGFNVAEGDDSENEGSLILTKQSKYNSFKIPDRSGFVGIWEHVINSEEVWDYIDYLDFKIQQISYYDDINKTDLVTITEDFPIIITDKSTVKFKKLNEFVLIQYHIEVKLLDQIENLALDNIIINMDRNCVKCSTEIWANGTRYGNGNILANANLNQDIFNCPSTNHFKILSYVDNDNNIESFSIVIKNGNNCNLSQEYSNQSLFMDGQIWATCGSSPYLCENLLIQNTENCQTLNITN